MKVAKNPVKVFKKRTKKSFSDSISNPKITLVDITCKALVADCKALKKFNYQSIYGNFLK